MKRSWTLLPLMLSILADPSTAKVWFVGGAGADFAEIQPAIDAAQDGDVILVRPGNYRAFTCSKGVMVAASSTPFVIVDDTQDPVIQDVPAGKIVGVSGLALDVRQLKIVRCQGEVVVGNVSANGLFNGHLDIRSCDNVS